MHHGRAGRQVRAEPHPVRVADLRETHGRYFFTAAELARRLRDAVSAA